MPVMMCAVRALNRVEIDFTNNFSINFLINLDFKRIIGYYHSVLNGQIGILLFEGRNSYLFLSFLKIYETG